MDSGGGGTLVLLLGVSVARSVIECLILCLPTWLHTQAAFYIQPYIMALLLVLFEPFTQLIKAPNPRSHSLFLLFALEKQEKTMFFKHSSRLK